MRMFYATACSVLIFLCSTLYLQAQTTNISGTLTYDINCDGIINGDDYGHPVITMELYKDVDLDGIFEPGGDDGSPIQTTNTDINGDYAFSVAGSNILTIPVDAGLDDAKQKGTNVDATGGDIKVKSDEYLGVRFDDVIIPANATITNAFIRFTAKDTKTGTAAITIKAQDSNNPLSFVDGNNSNISNRTLSSQSVSWNIPNWSDNQTYDTPNLSTIVQAMYNKGNFANNSIVFVTSTSSNNERKAHSYENSSSKAAKLIINYTVPGEGYFVKPASNNFTGLTVLLNPSNSAKIPKGTADATADFFLCGDSPLCYALGDDGNSSGDDLVVFNRVNSNILMVKNEMTTTMGESLVFNADGSLLYTFNGNQLVSINPITGAVTNIGSGVTAPGGMSWLDNSGENNSTFNTDFDGIALRTDGNLWASMRRTDSGPPWDAMIVVSTTTGNIVQDAITNGSTTFDGMVLYHTSPSPLREDIDDIALDPSTGNVYVVANDGGSGSQYLMQVDTLSGLMTYKGTISYNGSNLLDVEGFGFTNNGLLYITTGESGGSTPPFNSAYLVNLSTAVATNQVNLSTLSTDYEGCDCLSRGIIITESASIGDSIYHLTDGPIAGVKVNLYKSDGMGGYNLVTTQNTGADGRYLFTNLAGANYRIEVDPINFTSGGPLEGLYLHVDPDGGLDNISEYSLATNENNNDQDFGYQSFPLPVEYISFRATKEDGMSVLEWITGVEINNDRFEIERSSNGIDFEPIGLVQGSGNTYEEMNYDFVDRLPLNGANYYRLKQIDYDGASNYSVIRMLDFSMETDLSIRPNPTTGNVIIALNPSYSKIEYTIEILNVQGQLLRMIICSDECELDLSDMSQGLYHVIVKRNGSFVQAERLIKLK